MEEDILRVAEIIHTLVQNRSMVWDKDLLQHRPVRYDDFLVLCQTTTHMDEYLAEMLRKGIPVQLSGKADIFDVTAMYRFASIYRYLAYPNYKKAKEGAMQAVMGETISDLNQETSKQRLSGITDAVKDMNGIAMALYLARRLGYLLDMEQPIDRNALLRIQAQLQQMI